jgi:hypothetical protein
MREFCDSAHICQFDGLESVSPSRPVRVKSNHVLESAVSALAASQSATNAKTATVDPHFSFDKELVL